MDVMSDILLSEVIEVVEVTESESDETISEASISEASISEASISEASISEASISDSSQCSEATKIVKRMPRGRPRQFDYKTKQDYHKAYYILHKHKWNMDYQCPSCELVCSYVNKGRHEKSSYHLRIIEQKKAMSANTTIVE